MVLCDEALGRTLLISPTEQQRLRNSRKVNPGWVGLGELTWSPLVRLGIGHHCTRTSSKYATNRQYGAARPTNAQRSGNIVHDINPVQKSVLANYWEQNFKATF